MMHTKGPWKIGTYDEDGDIAIVTKKHTIALLDQRVFDYASAIDDETNKANAHLISAAPDMFDALEKALNQIESDLTDNFSVSREFVAYQIRKAMFKAKGGA